MSHNLIKVDSQESSRDGVIDLSLQSMTEAPSDYDILNYNSPNWNLQTFDLTSKTLFYTKYYQTYTGGTTGGNYANNDYFVWRTTTLTQRDEYKRSGCTTQAAQNATSPFTSNGTWRQSITLTTSGTYLFLIRPAFGLSFASNDSCTVQMYDSSSAFSSKLHVNSEGKFGDCLFGIKTITGSTVFKFIISDIVGTVDVLEQISRMFLSIQVLKLG